MSGPADRPVADVSSALLLTLAIEIVAVALLVVLSFSPELNPHLESAAFLVVLQGTTAALAFLIAWWLHQEVRISGHPGIAVLTVGYGGLGIILLGMAFLRDEWVLGSWGVFVVLWASLFATVSALLVGLRPLRKALQRVLGQGPGSFRVLGWIQFLLLSAGHLYLLRTLGARALIRSETWVFRICLVLSLFAIGLILHTYLRRRRQVILTFALAAVLWVLAIVAQWRSPALHLLWWYGQVLNFFCLAVIGYGSLEGHRVREREQLIAELEALSRQLEEQSLRDALTGCHNRRFAVENLDREYRKAARAGMALTLLVGDIDDFKRINDGYGHPAGDAVLQQVAARLRQDLRVSDILARCGGEEFWIILPQTNRVGGQEVAGKLLARLRSQPMDWEGHAIRVTMSIGAADNLSARVSDYESLIKEADRALYAAKHAGKDRAMTLDSLDSRNSRE